MPGPAGAVRGVLVVAHPRNRACFTISDRDQLARFAGHAGVALELEKARQERESLRRLEDHERIAADLHDHVIQELFATGMGLQSLLSQLTRPDQRARVAGFHRLPGRHHPRHPERHLPTAQRSGSAARPAETAARRAHRTDHPHRPDRADRVRRPPGRAAHPLPDDAIAVLREALSNTVRHAHASTVDVQITAAHRVLTVDVTDNGVGIGRPASASGLATLRRRAETDGGTLHLHTPPGGGTHVAWTATRPAAEHPAAGTLPPGDVRTPLPAARVR